MQSNVATSALAGTESPTLNADSQLVVQLASETVKGASAQSDMTDSDKRQALERATRAMQRTFLTWHAAGCMTAAAYTEARCTWERMLMTWGHLG